MTIKHNPTVSVCFHEPRKPVPTPWGWAHIPHPDPAVHQIHVMPLSDVAAHSFDGLCSCGPCMKEGFVNHYAFDGRERYEIDPRMMH